MSGLWYVVVPEAGANYVLNPSAETTENYGPLFVGSPSVSISPSGSSSPSSSASISPSASTSPSGSSSISPSASSSRSPSGSASPSGSTSKSSSVSPSPSPSFGIASVSRVTTRARYGVYSWFISTPKPYDGMWLGLSTLTNAAHYVSLYMFDNISGTPQVALDGHTFAPMTVIGGRADGWVRYGVSVSATEANASTRLDIRMTTEDDFYIDAVQVEPNSYGTTYMDGDMGGRYGWSGLRHGSASTRSAQERSGGRERNLLDDYGVEIVEGTKQIGMPPIINSLHGMALQPGALFQSNKVLPREIQLDLNYSSDSWSGFHGKRQDVIDILKPDLVQGSQPITIGYAGAGTDKKVYAQFYYNGGMEFGDFMSYDEKPSIRLIAPDPFWYSDDQETAALDYTDDITTAAYALRRTGGQWRALGTGLNGQVNVIATDIQRGRIYYGGQFTTANGVTVNRICYWNGSTFVAMGQGVGGTVNTIAIAANGDAWVGGAFTTVDGTSSRNYVARWNVSTNTWTNFGTTGTGEVYAIAINSVGLVYVLGVFTNWGADAQQDYVTSYNGSAWADVGTSPFTSLDTPGPHYAAVIDSDDNLLCVSSSATGATLRKWDGSAWTSSIVTDSSGNILALHIDNSGNIVVGGNFLTLDSVAADNIAIYNGASVYPLGTGVDNSVYTIRSYGSGLLVGGFFGTAGDINIADTIAFWNGTTWAHVDATLPGSAVTYAIAVLGADFYIGFDTTGTTTASGLTTVSPYSTAETYPRLTIVNANTSGSCILQWFENQTTEHKFYFNLTIQAGETVTLDLSKSGKSLTSDWRGAIKDNPLKNSDVVNWKLLPAPNSNTLATFITGTVTSVSALLHWTPRHWSIDGAAS